MIVASNFQPRSWMCNPHVQTLLGSFIGKNSGIETQRERVELPDGDFLDIDWLNICLAPDTPTLIILHGLEGSIESSYIQGLLRYFQPQQWRVAVLHFRGCSGELNRLARSYHSGDTEDLNYVIHQLPTTGPLYVVGFSLGGNVLLKYLGEQKTNTAIQAAVAVSVPFDLDKAARRLDQGLSKLYRYNLLKDIKHKALLKKSLFPNNDWPSEKSIRSYRSFIDFDHNVTAPLHGFESGKDYYERCSCSQFLKDIEVNTMILHAKDDPFMTEDTLPTSEQLASSVTLELSDYGGHVGFVGSRSKSFNHRHLDGRIIEWFTEEQAKYAESQKTL